MFFTCSQCMAKSMDIKPSPQSVSTFQDVEAKAQLPWALCVFPCYQGLM